MQREKLIKRLTYFYLIPLALMVAFNAINSLLRTTYFDLYKDMETAKYKWDNPLIVIVSASILFVLLYFVGQSGWFKKTDLPKVSVCFAGSICLVIVLMFRCEATCDSAALSDIAIEFMKGNYETFEQGGYLYSYSFQLGMTALLELIYTLFGVENFVVFQLLNIISIMVIIGMLNKITGELFEDENVKKMEAVLSMGMFPLFLFATFVYGDIIGWAFGVSAVYYIIAHLKTDDWRPVLKASLLLAAGTLVKSNINILVVAAVIAIMLNAIGKQKYKMPVLAVVLIIVSQLGVCIVNGVYTRRAGMDEYPAGIPKVAWIAMSMQEADEGGYACGWYNAYNWDVYRENGYDRELTTQACLDSLKESGNRFLHEQKYTIDFFYKKFTSQWNAPTFQAMITNEWASRYVENLSPVAEFFIYGFGRDILYGVMNVYHFFMFVCAAAFFFIKREKWSLPKAYFMLNIFGGLLFHMIWEAQSRYILGYFVLMLPIAASGCVRVFSWHGKKSCSLLGKSCS